MLSLSVPKFLGVQWGVTKGGFHLSGPGMLAVATLGFEVGRHDIYFLRREAPNRIMVFKIAASATI